MPISCRDSIVKRKSFAKITSNIPLPNLIEVQSRSFNDFVQLDCLPEERKKIGLERVFKNIFPINCSDKLSVEYMGYELGHWECSCGNLKGINERYSWSCENCNFSAIGKLDGRGVCTSCKKHMASYKRCSKCMTRVKIKPEFTALECKHGSQTFSMPLKIKIQVVSWERNEEKADKFVRDVKEQDIFFLDLPIMTDIYEEDGIYKIGSTAKFIINGVERVIVSQIHRSPGVIFSLSKKIKDQVASNFIARLIPMRGHWIDLEVDAKDLLYVKIDKTKKMLVTTFLQAFGIERERIAELFYRFNFYIVKEGSVAVNINEFAIGMRIEKGMIFKDYEADFLNKKINKDIIQKLNSLGINHLLIKKSSLLNRYCIEDIINQANGDIIAKKGDVLNEKLYSKICNIENLKFTLISSSGYVVNPVIHTTLLADKINTREAAIREVYSKINPGDNALYSEMFDKINSMFFSAKFYDLSTVGRIKINRKLGLDIPETTLHLTMDDIISTIRYLVLLREEGEGEIDDIDNLGNRRVRLVGELLANQIYSGMIRVEKVVKERYRMQDANKALTPYDLINAKPLAGIVREFFLTGQLSQFTDQTNPLSEIAHKRRLSSLGPGGVMKDRVTYEVRDVHTSHYGRICPIETPEGQSIGLISSLATLAYVNDLGFIETPYHPVVNGKIQKEIVFLDAYKELNMYVAQVELLKNDNLKDLSQKILARHQGSFIFADLKLINYVDVSPQQLFSVATSLIPFLQHDDASRALMGSNMQRQAVPLFNAQVPIIGTGLEKSIADASRSCLWAKYSGVVEYVSASCIIVRSNIDEFTNINDWISNGVEIYHLRYFEGSNYNTCVHQVPIVKVGDKINKDQILTNASAIVDGELALGSNLLVAYMPWRGYNYEDAIILNKRIVSDDLLTSIQIEEYIIDARDTRLGPEEITKDIPNVSMSSLKTLDDDGIIQVGARVKPGDILVGKITLKGDVQYSPEEKLLRAIFGEKSREVRDTSLRVPEGVEGVIIDVKVFSRGGSRKDERYKANALREADKLKKEHSLQKKILEDMIKRNVISLAKDKGVEIRIEKNQYRDISVVELENLSTYEILQYSFKDESINKKIIKMRNAFEIQLKVIDELMQEKISNLKRGDNLASGVLKMVKVYIASLRHTQVGDKMSGRHGNKGVVSAIFSREDMPFMDDGKEVDVILNPLGIPSRMNIGQILEMMLGLCGKRIGENFKKSLNENKKEFVFNEIKKFFGEEFFNEYIKNCEYDLLEDLARYISKNGMCFEASVFDSGSFEENIKPMMSDLNIPASCTFKLRDGKTGEYFDQTVMVGVMYMMKLNHMVDDKLHARSVGPYSLVTQQPLGGKAQMGGQRFGEMEVWALEAYGAAYMLQELLTYKSDDVIGRHKVYNALIRGEQVPEPGLPESFNVLIKELQALALKIDLLRVDKGDEGEL